MKSEKHEWACCPILFAKFVFIAVAAAIALLPSTTFGQAPDFRWAKTVAQPGPGAHIPLGGGSYPYGIAVDSQGNTLIAGTLLQSVSIFDSLIVTNSMANGTVKFVAKYDKQGSLLWLRHSDANTNGNAFDVAVDSAGNCYVTGSSVGPDDGFGLSDAGSGVFLSKFDSNGNLLWCRQSQGENLASGYKLALDGQGNVFLSGFFQSNHISFGSVTLTNSGLSPYGQDLFLVKFDQAGSPVWGHQVVGAFNDGGSGWIAADGAGNLLLAGDFLDFVDIGGQVITNVVNGRLFLAKYDNAGNPLWLKQAQVGGYISKVAVDGDGNPFITGRFSSPTATFDGVTLTNFSQNTNMFYSDAFLAKYDPSGNAVWAMNMGGNDRDGAFGLAVDAMGNSYVAGYFGSTNASFTGTTLTNAFTGGFWEGGIFIAKCDPSGQLSWARSAGGTGSGEARGIVVDSIGNAYIMGVIRSTNAYFDNIVLHPSNSQSDQIFIASLNSHAYVKIVTQPQSQIVAPGSNVTFSVVATGTPPLNFQWRLNGIDISGATAASYTRTNVQVGDLGFYSVIVTGPSNSLTSANATLAFSSAGVFSDDFETGDVRTSWRRAGSPLDNSTTTNHTVGGSRSAYLDNSSEKMFHNLGTEVSGHARATFYIYDSVGPLPTGQTRYFSEVAAYSGSGYGSGSVEQTFAIGRYSISFPPGNTGNLVGEGVNPLKYQGRVAKGANSGWFNLSGAANRSIGWHKFEIERLADGSTINFYVDGTLGRQITNATIAAWDSVMIGSANQNPLVTGDAWFDDVKVEYLDTPSITSQPLHQNVNVGDTVTFTVAASNDASAFQWCLNGIGIPGATNSSLTVSNALPGEAGNYTVIVMNSVGPTMSAPASLVVNVPSPSLHVSAGLNGSFDLSWSGMTGKTYRVQYKDHLNDASWTDLVDVTAISSTVTTTDSAGGLQRYYRIVVLP